MIFLQKSAPCSQDYEVTVISISIKITIKTLRFIPLREYTY